MSAGRLSISRISSNAPERDNMISITVEDKASGIGFVNVLITPEQFAMALTGLSSCECELELRGLQHVGKKRETKQLILHVSFDRFARKEDREVKLREAAAQYEVEGWMVNPYFTLNSQGGAKYVQGTDDVHRCRVNFTRYVAQENN